MASLLLSLLDSDQKGEIAEWSPEKRDVLMKVLYDVLYRNYDIVPKVGALLASAVKQEKDNAAYYGSVLGDLLKNEIAKHYNAMRCAPEGEKRPKC